MKNGILIIVAVLTFSMGYTQNNKAENINIEKEILKKARKYGDPSIVVSSLYRLIVLEGESSVYKDSLAYVYFSARKYAPCFMLTREVLERDPKNMDMMELNAISLESLGAYEKSITAYEKLLVSSNNNYHAYTLANIYFKMKKYDNAYTAIKKAETLNDEGKYTITYTINQNHTQNVELLAAISYLKGRIEMGLEKNDLAKVSFQKAVKIQSDFVFAKESIEALDKLSSNK